MTMNWPAFQLGFEAWDKYLETDTATDNPFLTQTEEWYSWNRGWNANQKGI